jgi:exopolysaccharide biosynthesis protein
MPTPTGPPPATPAPQAPATPPADSGWQAAAPGVELRRLRVEVGDQAAPVSVVRLDPAQVRLSVGYAPDAPAALSAWAAEAGAVAAINGGFFDEAGRTVALLVRGGQAVGDSYVGRGGMFAVTPEGGVWLRGLADAPYDPAEPVAEALQGWPMLVRPGGEAAYTYEDGARDRRSAIALDEAGRVLLIAAPTAAFTLRELSGWLAGSDLGVVAAVNLDGGSSTGLILRSEGAPERIDPFAPLPIVLLALPRE